MDWYLIRYFLAVAELGNFSKAAARANVTQPTLSAGIAKLENSLGTRLFRRDKRPVALTPAGSRFLIHARAIAHGYEQALSDVAKTERRPSLRVGILSTIPTAMLETAITLTVRGRQTENLEIIDGTEKELWSRLEDGAIDVALSILRAPSNRFQQESLAWENYVLVTGAHHRFADAASVNGQDLAEDIMIIRRHCEILGATSRYFTQLGVRPSFGLKTTNDDRALASIRAGLGITVMPESFRSAGIRHIKLINFNFRRNIGLIYPANRQSFLQSSEFVQAIKASYQQLSAA